MKGFIQTDIFCTVKEFYNIVKNDAKTYELMCHPGLTFGHYPEEMKSLETNIQNLRKSYKLITYNDI